MSSSYLFIYHNIYKELEFLPMFFLFWYECDSALQFDFTKSRSCHYHYHLSLPIVQVALALTSSLHSNRMGSSALSINSSIHHILYCTGPLLQLWSCLPEPQEDYFHVRGITFWDTRFLAISKLLIAFRHFLGNWRGAGQTRPVRPNVIHGARVIPWNHNIQFHSFMTRLWMTQFRNVIFVLWGVLAFCFWIGMYKATDASQSSETSVLFSLKPQKWEYFFRGKSVAFGLEGGGLAKCPGRRG